MRNGDRDGDDNKDDDDEGGGSASGAARPAGRPFRPTVVQPVTTRITLVEEGSVAFREKLLAALEAIENDV